MVPVHVPTQSRTTTSDLFREIELHVDGIDSGSITQERSEMAQQIGFDSDVAEELRTVSRMVPSDNNPNFGGEAAIIVNDQGLSPEDQDIIVYGIASSGVSGLGVFSISDSGVISASSSSSSPLPGDRSWVNHSSSPTGLAVSHQRRPVYRNQ